MPSVNQYKNKDGLYIRAMMGGKITTYQVTESGLRHLEHLNIGRGGEISQKQVIDMKLNGYIYTNSGGPGDIEQEVSVKPNTYASAREYVDATLFKNRTTQTEFAVSGDISPNFDRFRVPHEAEEQTLKGHEYYESRRRGVFDSIQHSRNEKLAKPQSDIPNSHAIPDESSPETFDNSNVLTEENLTNFSTYKRRPNVAKDTNALKAAIRQQCHTKEALISFEVANLREWDQIDLRRQNRLNGSKQKKAKSHAEEVERSSSSGLVNYDFSRFFALFCLYLVVMALIVLGHYFLDSWRLIN